MMMTGAYVQNTSYLPSLRFVCVYVVGVSTSPIFLAVSRSVASFMQTLFSWHVTVGVYVTPTHTHTHAQPQSYARFYVWLHPAAGVVHRSCDPPHQRKAHYAAWQNWKELSRIYYAIHTTRHAHIVRVRVRRRASHKGSARLPTTTTRARTTIIIIFKFVSVHNGALEHRRADARIGFCVCVSCAAASMSHTERQGLSV